MNFGIAKIDWIVSLLLATTDFPLNFETPQRTSQRWISNYTELELLIADGTTDLLANGAES